jgi:hypothetical protein
MIEYIIYPAIGFVAAFFGLEGAWHVTACKIRDRRIKPCIYKQMRLAITN